jgi:hypothetical protein
MGRCGYPTQSPMATVAQLVEHRVVILDVAGSSPVGRPFFTLLRLLCKALFAVKSNPALFGELTGSNELCWPIVKIHPNLEKA